MTPQTRTRAFAPSGSTDALGAKQDLTMLYTRFHQPRQFHKTVFRYRTSVPVLHSMYDRVGQTSRLDSSPVASPRCLTMSLRCLPPCRSFPLSSKRPYRGESLVPIIVPMYNASTAPSSCFLHAPTAAVWKASSAVLSLSARCGLQMHTDALCVHLRGVVSRSTVLVTPAQPRETNSLSLLPESDLQTSKAEPGSQM